jgi:hypothetical protein
MVDFLDRREQRGSAHGGIETSREVLSIAPKLARPSLAHPREVDTLLIPLDRSITLDRGVFVSICWVVTLAPHAGRREGGVRRWTGSA